MGGIDWTGLLKGMGLLALSVSGGLALGKAIIALSLPERLLGSLLPRLRRLRIPAQALFALGVSLGSSRAGSALVAEAYGQGILSEREALFGTLLQSFPGYLKRWLVSFPVAAALAGTAGAIYSAAVLARSFCRFLLFLFFLFLLRGRGATENEEIARSGTEGRRGREFSFLGTLARTLPAAWAFYALAYLATPALQEFIEARGASFPLLSAAGWTVAAASFAHVNAALGVAGGALASGSLTTAQAVLALLTGNMLAVLSRVLRQDIAFWIGIFPGRMVRSLFLWNLVTLVATMAATVFLAALPVLWGW
ncbi:hypothetical protein SDC9_98726 [bioreactor metagenome]|uniref:Nucleoside transporter/FeoB GTPase Gate domain-containing protein n=1 Tax=bioreactor metagenome TaxID=1076179 RepID=A0A645AMC0_9ZZZZ